MNTRSPITESSIVVVLVIHKGFYVYRHYILGDHPMLFNALGSTPTITPLDYLYGVEVMDDTCDDDVLISWGICNDVGNELGPVTVCWFNHLGLSMDMAVYLDRIRRAN